MEADVSIGVGKMGVDGGLELDELERRERV